MFLVKLKTNLINAYSLLDAYVGYDKITNLISDDKINQPKTRLQILILLKIQKLWQWNILAKKFVFIIGKYSKL